MAMVTELRCPREPGGDLVPAEKVSLLSFEAKMRHQRLHHSLPVKRLRDLVDRLHVRVRYDALRGDAGEQSQLLLGIEGKRLAPSHHDDVRLDADAPQLLDAVLRRLGLHLPHSAHLRRQSDMDEERVLEPVLQSHLSESL